MLQSSAYRTNRKPRLSSSRSSSSRSRFDNSGDRTPPTQVHTGAFSPHGPSFFAIRTRIGIVGRRSTFPERNPVNDRDFILPKLHSIDDQADQLLPLGFVEAPQPTFQAAGEVADLCNHLLPFPSLNESLLHLFQM